MTRLCTIALLVCLYAAAQESAKTMGEIVTREGGRIDIRTDQGETLSITSEASTAWWRVPPGEKDLKKAARITAADAAPGDRVLARGALSADRKSLAASTVVVMAKSDLERKQQAEREQWIKRGAAGRITALDPAKREIAITVLAREGKQPLAIDASGTPEFLRYAPDSAHFHDARPSSFEELHTGDQVRVVGDRTPDGARIKAERILSGAFHNLAGTVESVDPAARQVRLRDLDTKKSVTLRLAPDSNLRRLPPMLAAMLGRRLNGGGARAQEPPRPAGAQGPSGDLHDMLDRLPALELNELKPGDAVIAATTQDQAIALTLLAGVEPLLTAPSTASRTAGAWNFGDIVLPQ